MVEGQTGMWDPLWEYVLDDYEADDVARKARRKKKVESSLLDLAYLDEEESEYDPDSSNRRGWFDNRDDREAVDSSWGWAGRDAKPETSSKRHAWRRNHYSEKEVNDDRADESMWDMFVPPESNVDTGGENKVSKKESYKESSRVGTSHQTIRQKDAPEKADNERKTKIGFLRRFRKQQGEPDIQVTEQRKDDTERVNHSSIPKRNIPEERRNQKKDEERDESFSPLSMIFEVAEKLDPWASDSDSKSHSDSTASDRTDQTDDDTAHYDEDTHEAQNEQRSPEQRSPEQRSPEQRSPKQRSPSSNFTEIRLTHTPEQRSPEHRSPSSSLTEIRLTHKPEREKASYDSQPTGILKNAVPYDESSSTITMPVQLSRSRASVGIECHDSESLQRESAAIRKIFPSDERVDDQSSAPEIDQDPNKFQLILPFPTDDEEQARAGWKRVVCCSIKNNGNRDAVNQLNFEDVREVFPATRMIGEDNTEVSSIVGRSADYVNGVMGVPSDRFLQAKGPQSLYAYDYESNEHMDIIYTEFCRKPRSALTVRHLGSPPALLSSSSADAVVIQVEASTVSDTDCIIRQGNWWGEDSTPLLNTPGVDVVGKVYHIKQRATTQFGLHPRQTVLSLVKWGGNSRYMSIRPEKLVKVPEGIDPAQAACLPETYLTAFQVLHYGQSGSVRYRENSLKGKSILIIGAMANNMGKAIIELALSAGAASVYATAKKKHWKTIISYGIMPLSPDPMEWILRVEGTIDLILATNGDTREDVSTPHYRALNSSGHLILSGRRIVGNDLDVGDRRSNQQTPLICSKNKALTKLMNQTHSYDVYEQWENDLDTCKKDLTHLLKLLKRGAIKPKVLDRIALNKVPRAHELLESKRLSGFLVCEPWIRSKKRAVYI